MNYSTPIRSLATGGALALGLGALLRWTSEVLGGTPLVLLGTIAAACLALGLAHTLRMDAGRPGSRLLLAVFAPILLWLAQDIGRSAVLSAALFAGATWGRAASPLARGPSALALAALGLLVGFALPLPGLLLGLGLLASVDLRPEPDRSGPSEAGRGWVGSWGPAICLGLSVALAISTWSAARGALDPTPAGLLVVLGVGALAAALAAATLPAGLGTTASALAVAAVLTRIGLAALPYRSQLWLGELAGTEDPRLLLMGMLAALVLPAGLAAGAALPAILVNRSREGVAWVAVAVGLILGLWPGPDLGDWLILGAAVAGVVGLLSSARVGPRLPALGALAAAGWVVWVQMPWPEASLPLPRATTLRSPTGLADQAAAVERNQLSAAGWGPDGSVRIELRDGRLERAVFEGRQVRTKGRMADAERLAGHLAPALAPNPDRALVLGDDLGLVTQGLVTQLVERVVVAVPDTQGLRAVAAVDEPMKVAFFDPSVLLVRGTNEQVLRERSEQDLIVEVARVPWQDARGGVPGPIQLRARRKALSDPGVYLLVLDLGWLEEEEFRGVVGDLLEEFASVQAFLPPQGGDQVLLAGWKTTNRVAWDGLIQAAALGRLPLAELGVRSAIDLADRGIVSTGGLEDFAEGGKRPARWRLPSTLHRPPRLLLASLEPHVQGPDDWIENTLQPEAQEELRSRSESARRFLQLLKAVPDGDLPAILAAAHDLDARSLDPLIEPHLESARALIARGIVEGPTSMAWPDCVRQLETARLVSPRSAQVMALMGRCHMVQDPNRARDDFEAALEHDPTHLDALLGLAQLQVKRGEWKEAQENLQKATAMHPRRYEPFLHLGSLLLAQGQLDEAEDYAFRAKTLAPENCAALVLVARIRIQQGDAQGGLTNALIAEQTCDDAESWYWKGVAYGELNQLAQARDAYQRAILRDPNHWYAHAGLGSLDLPKDPCAALRSFNTAKALSPSPPPDLNELRDEAGRRCEE